MKAKIRKTGEIVNVQPGSLIAVLRDGDEAWNGEELEIEDVEILPDGYEEVRTRAAIAAMQGMLSCGEGAFSYQGITDEIAKAAVDYADSLITELKRKVSYESTREIVSK